MEGESLGKRGEREKEGERMVKKGREERRGERVRDRE